MIYQELAKINENEPQIYARIDDDGKCRLTCTDEYPDFQAWVAAGGVPEEVGEA